MQESVNSDVRLANRGTILGGGWQQRLGLGRFAGPLSPINQRRWANFRSNRRAYISLILFGILFVLTMLAEMIANDKPIIARYKGETLYPVFVDYPESKFGGFLAVTDYKDPVIFEEIQKEGWMFWPPIRHSSSSINKDYPRRRAGNPGGVPVTGASAPTPGAPTAGECLGFPSPPIWASTAPYCDTAPEQLARYNALGNRNWLGTDDQGRDVLARVIYGFRISVLFGLILTVLGSIIGIAAGAVQGYFGGKVDLVFQRFLEIWGSMPQLYVLIIIAAMLVPGFWTLLFVLLAFEWTSLVGVVRAEFLRGRNYEYIKAARALGLSDTRIMTKHVLPNAMVATMTYLPFELSGAVTALTALDYLGLGLPPGSPSLGELLAQGKTHIQAPWLGLTAFVTIAGLLSMLIFIGEGVRDALDPRKTFRASAPAAAQTAPAQPAGHAP